MIDTEKYEGHTEGPWNAEEEEVEEGKAWTVRGGDHWVVMESDGCLRIDWKREDALLTADAPLLLAEVKELQAWKKQFSRLDKLIAVDDFVSWVKETHPHHYHRLMNAYEGRRKTMTQYPNNTTHPWQEIHIHFKDPAFWKSLKQGDEVCGRTVITEAKDTACGWPFLDDLMDDEVGNWKVCRAGYHKPWCGCEGDEHLEEYE